MKGSGANIRNDNKGTVLSLRSLLCSGVCRIGLIPIHFTIKTNSTNNSRRYSSPRSTPRQATSMAIPPVTSPHHSKGAQRRRSIMQPLASRTAPATGPPRSGPIFLFSIFRVSSPSASPDFIPDQSTPPTRSTKTKPKHESWMTSPPVINAQH